MTPEPDSAERPFRWVLLGAVLVVATMPFWAFAALPFQDLPAHAGLIALRQRYATSLFEQRLYKLDTSPGPYSVFLFLGDWLGRAVGPLGAVRVLGGLPVLAIPAALLHGRRVLHDDRTIDAGFIGVALSFGFMAMLGLASYLFGAALCLVALTAWLDLLARPATEPRAGKEARFGALSVLVLAAHGHAFAILVFLVAVTALSAPGRRSRLLRARALVPAVTLAAVALARQAPPAGSAGRFQIVSGVQFQGPLDKLSLLVTPALSTRTGVDLAMGLALWIVLGLALAATVRERPRAAESELAGPGGGTSGGTSGGQDAPSRAHTRALAVASAALFAAFLVLPHASGWLGFIDGRLVPLILWLWVLAYRPAAMGPRLRRALRALAPLSACVIAAVLVVATARFQREADGYEAVLAQVPAEASVFNAPLDADSAVFTAHPFVHYDKLIAVREPVVLSDVWAYPGSALYPTADNPAARLPVTYRSADMRTFSWSDVDLSDWDYVLVRTRPDGGAPAVPDSLSLVQRDHGWWLFRTGRAIRRPSGGPE